MKYLEMKQKAKELGIASFGVTKVKLAKLIADAEKVNVENPQGVVSSGSITPPQAKVKVKLEPDNAEYKAGDVVQDILTGEKFVVESVNGETVTRRVNQTGTGVRVYNMTALRMFR